MSNEKLSLENAAKDIPGSVKLQRLRQGIATVECEGLKYRVDCTLLWGERSETFNPNPLGPKWKQVAAESTQNRLERVLNGELAARRLPTGVAVGINKSVPTDHSPAIVAHEVSRPKDETKTSSALATFGSISLLELKQRTADAVKLLWLIDGVAIVRLEDGSRKGKGRTLRVQCPELFGAETDYFAQRLQDGQLEDEEKRQRYEGKINAWLAFSSVGAE